VTILRRPDPRTVALAGLTTCAWYAVPDVVGPRWGRALAKTAVATAGTVLAVAATRDGRELRDGIRGAVGEVRSVLDDDGRADHRPDTAATDDDNPTPLRPQDGGEEVVLRAPVAAGAAVVGLTVTVALVVAGEKWAYRRGEALRARGVRAPHTRVGLVVGLLTAALAAVDVDLDDEPAPAAPAAA
jgi:hypothetical protein